MRHGQGIPMEYGGQGRNLSLQPAVGSKLHCRYGAARSLDLLRQNIQRLVNKDIDSILKKYLEKFFEPALANIRKNLGDDSLTQHSLRIVCIQMLEEAKAQYYVSTKKEPKIPAQRIEPRTCDIKVAQDAMLSSSVVVSTAPELSCFDSGKTIAPNQSSSIVGYPSNDVAVDNNWENRKKMTKSLVQQSYVTASPNPIKTIQMSGIRREGPKWDPNRITSSTLFIMGARANKVLGFGQNRGRLYTKHPELMKYSGDTEDKEWLSRNNLMPPTGGIAYLLVLDDIKELSLTPDYKYNPNVLLHELKGFQAPEFMLMKIRMFMAQMRSEGQDGQSRFIQYQFTDPACGVVPAASFPDMAVFQDAQTQCAPSSSTSTLDPYNAPQSQGAKPPQNVGIDFPADFFY